MKYCLKCGEIVSDNSVAKDRARCSECGTLYEEDNMTGEMFEALSETEKQKYADELFEKIKSSDIFNKKLFDENVRRYGKKSLYSLWWYDKAKQLGQTFNHRYRTDEEREKEFEEQFGKNSPAYHEAVIQNLINESKKRKAENSNIPKCPTCSSTNLKKISTTSKVVNTAMWGIFGTKRHKTFHCNSCGYEW